ncbi:MAG: hypothetical protein VX589_08715, partial [Myxococcota bacterium]|nr:hypothetical protein [Myxococcota bacterium]
MGVDDVGFTLAATTRVRLMTGDALASIACSVLANCALNDSSDICTRALASRLTPDIERAKAALLTLLQGDDTQTDEGVPRTFDPVTVGDSHAVCVCVVFALASVRIAG